MNNNTVYQIVTDRIIAQMEKGIIPWNKPWHGSQNGAVSHSTGHVSRLNRLTTGAAAAFGGTDYSKEELTAELGSAYLMNHCGINTESTERNSAAYLQSWLRALRNDPKMIVGAASKAEKAVALILGQA